jgi:hypothetical protein
LAIPRVPAAEPRAPFERVDGVRPFFAALPVGVAAGGQYGEALVILDGDDDMVFQNGKWNGHENPDDRGDMATL